MIVLSDPAAVFFTAIKIQTLGGKLNDEVETSL